MELYPLWVLLIAAGVTLFTRALPFAVFGGKRAMPGAVRYLGGVLPGALPEGPARRRRHGGRLSAGGAGGDGGAAPVAAQHPFEHFRGHGGVHAAHPAASLRESEKGGPALAGPPFCYFRFLNRMKLTASTTRYTGQ